jgi:glycosyltransferase EpsH
MKPKISVIIPVYKVENYIRGCLESVLAQTFRDIEIIVVNDGTPDNSAEIVREYAAKDQRIKVIDQPNSGIAATRNTGLAAVSAPLVMFVDSDDEVEPTYCQKLHAALTDGIDCAVCGVRFVYENMPEDPRLERYFDLPPRRQKETISTLWNKIYRMSIIREHGIEFPAGLRHEDDFFWNAYQPWCRAVAFVPEKLYRYLRRPGSIMSDVFARNHRLHADKLQIAVALGNYYHTHGLMQNEEWAEHFWRLFDRLAADAQMHRPRRFRPRSLRKKRLTERWKRLFGIKN